MKKIVFLCDFFVEDILGGGEICNESLINYFKDDNYDVLKLKTSNVSLEKIMTLKDSFFIVGNFVNLQQSIIDYISENIRYIIYEHDYKFVKNRNPAKYLNFLVDKQDLINLNFYKNAKQIICQSKFQKDIFEKNLSLDNIFSSGNNFWFKEHYDLMEEKSKHIKKNKAAIIDYQIQHKNTLGAIEYCKKNNINYDLIKSNDYIKFLEMFGNYNSFVFLPQTPETFSRTCIEARMMNVSLHINGLIGCAKEDWFKGLKGVELINFLKQKNKETYLYFKNLI